MLLSIFTTVTGASYVSGVTPLSTAKLWSPTPCSASRTVRYGRASTVKNRLSRDTSRRQHARTARAVGCPDADRRPSRTHRGDHRHAGPPPIRSPTTPSADQPWSRNGARRARGSTAKYMGLLELQRSYWCWAVAVGQVNGVGRSIHFVNVCVLPVWCVQAARAPSFAAVVLGDAGPAERVKSLTAQGSSDPSPNPARGVDRSSHGSSPRRR